MGLGAWRKIVPLIGLQQKAPNVRRMKRRGCARVLTSPCVAGRTKKKRNTLPRDFVELLKSGDLATLQAVFETCDVDAREGFAKRTALAFDECPDALARWLVSRGADLGATDTWGNTPLHSRARSWRSNIAVLLELGADVNADTASIGTPLHAAADSKHAETARQLLLHGARVDALNKEGLTPLEIALRGCNNADLDRMPAFVKVMLDAGAARTPAMKSFVEPPAISEARPAVPCS